MGTANETANSQTATDLPQTGNDNAETVGIMTLALSAFLLGLGYKKRYQFK